MNYHFGVPGVAVWLSHILIGALLIYSGYMIASKQKLGLTMGIIIVVIGVLALLYHAHLWYYVEGKKKIKIKIN
jgi:hypothetical protein